MEKKSKNKGTSSIGSKVTKKTTSSPKNKKEKTNKKKHPVLKKIIIISVLLFVLAILVGIGIFCGIFFSDKFALSREDLLLSNANTTVYDKNGTVIAELSGDENREIITIADMTEYLPKAFVAIEDERFYSHKGVDIKRTLAATGTYLLKGDSSFGGSTITQQLVKNITNERDNSGSAGVERKIKEMSRAYQVEKMISKDQILELYLNIIPLGADGKDICGVEMAATYYFNKSASELSIEECAFLAGINNAPNTYNPFKNAGENGDAAKQEQVMNKIKTRTKTVLAKMKELKYITEEQYNEAYQKVESGIAFNKGQLPSSTVRSYFIQLALDEVINDLVEEKGFSEEYAKSRVYGGGYKIYLTQDSGIQANIDEVYRSGNYILTSPKSATHSQSAMVIIDHTTGQVVGLTGGLGSDVDAIGLNRANIVQQTGSSIKPIVTYGYGIESRTITAATVYNDAKTAFGKWEPKNDSGGFSGYITVRNAIERSVNIVACKIMSELGPDNAIDFARKCGISTLIKASEVEKGKNNDSNISSMALGGQTVGVTPLEMAAAYAMIANNGVYISPTFYTKVEDSAGNIVVESKQTSERVMTEQHAYIMKTLLKQPVEGGSGTARVCRMNNFDVGAKTGTTNDKKDNWLCGFTPYYTAAAWYGYDDNNVVINGSGNNAAKLWADVMKKVHTNLNAAKFTEPSGIVKLTVCKKSGCRATSSCSETYTEYFVQGEEPGTCEGHALKVCSDSHKIATEFCPNTYYYSFLPEKEKNPSWKTTSDESVAPTETCTMHTGNTTTVDTNVPNTKVPESTDITVPNIIGLSETDAKAKLRGLGLTVFSKTKNDPTKKDGVVIQQSINPNDVVEKNTAITITINKLDRTPDSGNNTNPDRNLTNNSDSNTTRKP